MYQCQRLTQSILDQLKRGKLLSCWGPKLCLRSVGHALLVDHGRVREEQRHEFLEGRRQLRVEVYVALQVPSEA